MFLNGNIINGSRNLLPRDDMLQKVPDDHIPVNFRSRPRLECMDPGIDDDNNSTSNVRIFRIFGLVALPLFRNKRFMLDEMT